MLVSAAVFLPTWGSANESVEESVAQNRCCNCSGAFPREAARLCASCSHRYSSKCCLCSGAFPKDIARLCGACSNTYRSKCFVCGKPRKDHYKNRFCPQPKNKAGSKSDGKGSKKGKKDRGSTPAWMFGHAQRLTPSKQYPQGQYICADYHQPNGQGCNNERCNRAHKCPRFLNDGSICGGAHVLQRFDRS